MMANNKSLFTVSN